jgi:uncharacterized membrane protein YgcG
MKTAIPYLVIVLLIIFSALCLRKFYIESIVEKRIPWLLGGAAGAIIVGHTLDYYLVFWLGVAGVFIWMRLGGGLGGGDGGGDGGGGCGGGCGGGGGD